MPKRSSIEASRLLAEYEQLNSDLPRSTRQSLAPFALAYKVGKAALSELYERSIGTTPYLHRSYFYWQALSLSSLSFYWHPFSALHNHYGYSTHDCLLFLYEALTSSEWELFNRRLGHSPPIYPTNYHPSPPSIPPRYYWSKGGQWSTLSGFTKIIWNAESLDRDYSYSYVTEALNPSLCRTIELELHSLIDPDALLYPDALTQATEYVRTRIPTILGWKRQTTSYKVASWFFQSPVPHPSGGWMKYTFESNYPRRIISNPNTPKQWQWTPSDS